MKEGYRNPTGFRRWVKVAGSGGLCYTCVMGSSPHLMNYMQECTDAEKKQFMQAFIERIDIFPERQEDGNWIRNIKFQFPVPILRDVKEVVRVDGISLDKEQSDEHTVTLEKFPTLETVVSLSRKEKERVL